MIDHLEKVVVPPPFHGFEGCTNKIISSMREIDELEGVMKKWVKDAAPNPLNYHDGSLNGNDCHAMMKNFHFLKEHENAKKWYILNYKILFD